LFYFARLFYLKSLLLQRVNFTNILRADFCQFPFAKKLKHKLRVQYSCTKHFRTKKSIVKCWWNWHLVSFYLKSGAEREREREGWEEVIRGQNELSCTLYDTDKGWDVKTVRCNRVYQGLGQVTMEYYVRFWPKQFFFQMKLPTHKKMLVKKRSQNDSILTIHRLMFKPISLSTMYILVDINDLHPWGSLAVTETVLSPRSSPNPWYTLYVTYFAPLSCIGIRSSIIVNLFSREVSTISGFPCCCCCCINVRAI
jgi:hypothetical protein